MKEGSGVSESVRREKEAGVEGEINQQGATFF
jgi:hypothetical protein